MANEPQLLKPKIYQDNRGYFVETWNKRRLFEEGINCDFVQDNLSMSKRKGTIRGLHYQAPPYAQAKLVRCNRGAIFDIVVDIRRNSPNFARWRSYVLSQENGYQLFVPEGFLHGFMTLEVETEVFYKCSSYYECAAEGSVRFDDPDIDIDWPLSYENSSLSEKDSVAPYLREIETPFCF